MTAATPAEICDRPSGRSWIQLSWLGHSISPLLDKQLVLELKIGVEFLEVFERFPGRCLYWKAFPLH